MSMLNTIPSSRTDSLNHVLEWKKVFEKCKTHQDNYYNKDSKCNIQCVIKISFIWHSDLFWFTRYNPYSNMD